MPQSIIFDMDGTLFQTEKILELSLDDTFDYLRLLNKWDTEKIIKKYGSTNTAVVGDRLSDINAAKDNGLVSIGCNFDFAREDELSQADIVIDDLIELKTIFPRLNR